MDRRPHDHLARRREGRRRAGAVTAWSAAAGTGLTVAFGVLFSQATAQAEAGPDPVPAVEAAGTAPEAAPAPSTTQIAHPSSTPRATPSTARRPQASRTTLAPPPAPPKAASSGGRRHASSGAS